MADGLITLPSSHPVAETISRLAEAAAAAGLQVFARIDHAAGAADAGLDLRPTQLLIFGQARGGTPLMQQAQTAGIDLPLKALAWTDAGGQTWLSYNDPAWIARRHELGETGAAVIEALQGVLAKLATAAADGWRGPGSATAGSLCSGCRGIVAAARCAARRPGRPQSSWDRLTRRRGLARCATLGSCVLPGCSLPSRADSPRRWRGSPS